MISPASLQRQKFLSLTERVQSLWNEHSLHISRTFLKTIYNRHGITYKKAKAQRKSLIADRDTHDRNRLKIA